MNISLSDRHGIGDRNMKITILMGGTEDILLVVKEPRCKNEAAH
ncbi:MAG: hypothetical protein V1921_07625 [Candidatus Altiarchaeota archaeon]